MIEVENLTKKYGSFKAVDDLSFQVQKGEILGFLGPNGAGKSTTMKILSCFISPTSGTARIGGYDILNDSLKVKELIGYLPESAPSYKDMTVAEFLRFIGEVRGFEKAELKQKTEKVIETTSLEKVVHQTINTLSKGFRQRVGFAQALIHDPPVLILDEPTDGLDPNQKHEVRTLIQKMSHDKAIILSTHILEEMEAVCSRALIINMGKIVADGTPDELLSQSDDHNAVTLIFGGQVPEAVIVEMRTLTQIKEIKTLNTQGDQGVYKIQIIPKDRKNILMDINQYVAEKKLSVVEIFSEKGQMDQVFRNLTLG